MKVDLITLLISLVLAGGPSARPMYGRPYHEEELAKSIRPLDQQSTLNLWRDSPTQHQLMPPSGQIAAPAHPILGLHASSSPQHVKNGLAHSLSRPHVQDIPAVPQMLPAVDFDRLNTRFANNPEEAPKTDRLFTTYTYIQNGVKTDVFNAIVLQNYEKAMLHIQGLTDQTAQYRIWLPFCFNFLHNEVQEISKGITKVYEMPVRKAVEGSTPTSPPVIQFYGLKAPKVPAPKIPAPKVPAQKVPAQKVPAQKVPRVQPLPDPASVYPQRFVPKLSSDEKDLNPRYLEEDVE